MESAEEGEGLPITLDMQTHSATDDVPVGEYQKCAKHGGVHRPAQLSFPSRLVSVSSLSLPQVSGVHSVSVPSISPPHLSQKSPTDSLVAQNLAELLCDERNQNYVRRHAVAITEVSLEAGVDGGIEQAEFVSTQYAACDVFKYKKVANRVKPVASSLPQEFRIERRTPSNPLADLPTLPTHPPPFTPGDRYTQERMEKMRTNLDPSLSVDETNLIHSFFRSTEFAFAWDESEKGIFSRDYFPPVRIPTLQHDPWIFKNIPIPRGLYPQIIGIIKAKIDAGTIEPSNAAYRSQWFWVLKKDGKSLRIVHNLQPLNAVTIKDSAVPPVVEPYAETFAGRACYSVLDLFVGFDQRELDPESRNLTTFQTPLGTFRLTRIPMGYTNSQQVQHGDLCYLLQDEIPDTTMPFVDDVPVRGPPTRYELPGGGFETIPENPNIRRFVWEHMNDVLRVVWRVGKAGGTFSGPKAYICVPEAVIVGHLCTYDGRRPVPDRVDKIVKWGIPRSLTEVRGFLGVLGTLRMFIRDFAMHAEPLVKLMRKKSAAEFEFGIKELEAMEKLKVMVASCPAIRPIEYECDREVILAVDSSNIAVGYVLYQMGIDCMRYPSRFGSITWNEVERRYSQSKIELFGLFRALRDVRVYIIAVRRLVVEVDARYIKGMINNPDVQPNASINRWIAGILLFDFELRHVPAKDHTAADGLSRRRRSEEEGEQEGDDYEGWIDEANAFAVELLNWSRVPVASLHHMSHGVESYLSMARGVSPPGVGERVPRAESLWFAHRPYSVLFTTGVPRDAGVSPPRDKNRVRHDDLVTQIESYLRDPQPPREKGERDLRRFLRYASRFFMLAGRLY